MHLSVHHSPARPAHTAPANLLDIILLCVCAYVAPTVCVWFAVSVACLLLPLPGQTGR